MSDLTPTLTLAQVFGPGVVYVPRRSPNLPGWSAPTPGSIDFLTGLQVGIAGGMPYVASQATLTPLALELRAEAGLPAQAELHSYGSTGEYLEVLKRLRGAGNRLAAQRVHPEDEIPGASGYPPGPLLARLNDKGRMKDVVPQQWLPARRILPTSELPSAEALLADSGCIVLKAATERPSGGGHGVWICRAPGEVEAARALLAQDPRVVVEEYLDLRRTVCLHGIVSPDGSVRYLGAAEEIVRNGRWLGNWHDDEGDTVPAAVVAAVIDVVQAAAALGYRGISGIDVAELRDGSWRIIDLNFRVNGSTAGAWLRPSIAERRGAAVIRGRSWSCKQGFPRMIAVAREAVRRGTLVPLGFYDPDACAEGGLPRMAGLLLGASRGEIEEECARLGVEGLD